MGRKIKFKKKKDLNLLDRTTCVLVICENVGERKFVAQLIWKIKQGLVIIILQGCGRTLLSLKQLMAPTPL